MTTVSLDLGSTVLFGRSVRSALLAAVLLVGVGCGTRVTPPPSTCGPAFFGNPVAQTGLSSAECGASCGCAGSAFTPAPWTDERLARLLTWQLLDPPPDLSSDPYASPAPPVAEGVCAVRVVDATAKTYRLETHASFEAAATAGLAVTHADPCGACSTLADLAVYAKENDLGRKVQDCGVKTLTGTLEMNIACLEQLGFTKTCARIWAYNTRFTRTKCLGVCFTLLDAPYHLPDGGLNGCLACDERESGPHFKAVAGRTRRNTGLPSAICRPCSEVHAIAHDWQ